MTVGIKRAQAPRKLEVRMRRSIGMLGITLMLMSCSDQDVVETVAGPLSLGTPTYDPIDCQLHPYETTCTYGGVTMHCCAAGKAMTGVHLDDDTLECQTVDTSGLQPSCTLWNMSNMRTFEGQSVPACPAGTYMRGFQWHTNQATCCVFQSTNRPTSEFLDGFGEGPTQDTDSALHKNVFGGCYSGTMHGCAGNAAMVGLNTVHNWLACAQ